MIELALSVQTCERLFQWDTGFAEAARRRGCPYCGGALHRADYPRKVRGVGERAQPYFERRFSFCCSRTGCRRRVTPPSVRFVGQKIYAALCVLLTAAADTLCGAWDAVRRQRRWRRWFRESFAKGPLGREFLARFAGGIAQHRLPASLLSRFAGKGRVCRGLSCLRSMADAQWDFAVVIEGRCAAAEDGG